MTYEELLSKLAPCSKCGSQNLTWCGISVRPYCLDCKRWGRVNHGTPQDAIDDWNEMASRAEARAEERRDAKKVGPLEAERDRLLDRVLLLESVLREVMDRFGPCRGQYIYSKRMTLDRVAAILKYTSRSTETPGENPVFTVEASPDNLKAAAEALAETVGAGQIQLKPLGYHTLTFVGRQCDDVMGARTRLLETIQAHADAAPTIAKPLQRDDDGK